MRVIDPQSAALTNIEVLSYLTTNPPRRPPNPPASVNARNFIPSPDLRDHNTVVKEINNYVTRLSPHLLRYPRYTNIEVDTETGRDGDGQGKGDGEETTVPRPTWEDGKPTAMDEAFRTLITRLKPFGLTKAEVLIIVNLGIGVRSSVSGNGDGNAEGEGQVNGEGEMDVDQQAPVEDGDAQAEGEPAEEDDPDYGAKVLLDSVIEEREERLTDEDVGAILEIVREVLGSDSGGET